MNPTVLGYADTLKTNKGHPKLFFNEYSFVKLKKLSNATDSYECTNRRRNMCPAKLHIIDEKKVVKIVNEHNHAPIVAEKENTLILNSLKDRALNCRDTTQQIVEQCTQGASKDSIARLPSLHHAKRTVRNQRSKSRSNIPCPQDSESMVLPDDFKNTASGENFVIFDSGPSCDRMVIFGTEEQCELLGRSSVIFADATFSVVPLIFFQLLTVHAMIAGKGVPCLYVLMSNKRQPSYVKVWQQIKKKCPTISNATFMTDFELANINALRLTFPQSRMKACFFHFKQCIWRKVQSCGLQKNYITDEDLNLKIRMLGALSFLPVDKIESAFEELVSVMPKKAESLVEYFEHNFIGTKRSRVRKEPLFNKTLWNCHDLIRENLPKTNNICEAYHRKLKNSINCAHPSLWNFLDALKSNQANTRMLVNQILTGHFQEPPRKKYKDLIDRLHSTVLLHEKEDQNGDMMDHVTSLARSVQ